MEQPPFEVLADAVARLGRASVLVVGDAMLDRYVYGDVDRISQEAPVPVLCVGRELALPGGAANVVRNLGALGAAVAFVSVVGDDQPGSDLTGLIGGQPGVEPWLLVQGGRVTTLKCRFIGHGQQLLRTDREDVTPIHPKLAERMVRIARDAIAATSVTILSDYGKGVLDGEVTAQLLAAARQAGRPVLVDMRGPDFARYAGADLLTTSWRNLCAAIGRRPETDAAVAAAAGSLREAHDLGAVVIRRTGHSLTVVSRDADAGPDLVLHLRNHATEASDTRGLGDTVVAVLAAARAVGAPLPVAACLANAAASVLVGRVGTALARASDLLAALAPRSNAHKIVSREAAAERVERWRRVGWRAGLVFGAFDGAGPEAAAMLDGARGSCDRLTVALAPDNDGDEPEAVRAARLAALPCVDLVVSSDSGPAAELLRALRPELLIEAGPAPGRNANAELVREWGGRVLPADAAIQPEPV